MPSCDRGCYTIGGPFIEEDPNCPIHGRGGTEEQQNKIEDLELRIQQLEERVARLEAK